MTAATAIVTETKKLLPFGKKSAAFIRRHPKYDKKITILEGSVRSAKTWTLDAKVLPLCDYDVAGHRIIFGVTKQTIQNNVLDDLFEILGESNYDYNRQSGELDIMGVKWNVIGAKDEGSEKIIRGMTVGIAVGDEVVLIPWSFMRMLLNRMSPAGARLYGSTNPDVPMHPLYEEVLENKALVAANEVETLHFTLDDNPNVGDDYKAYLDRLYVPGSLYHQRFVRGLRVIGEGSIIKDCWSDTLLYDDEPWTMDNGQPGAVIPQGLRSPARYVGRYVLVDCGVDHPQIYIDMIDDIEGTVWMDRLYFWDSNDREIMRQKTDSQYCDDLEQFIKGEAIEKATEYTPGRHRACEDAQVIIPPECASFKQELRNRGIWHCEADNEVLDGIKMMCSMMALRKVRFHRRMEKGLKQLLGYVWDPKAKLHGVEQPLKQKDDFPDAVRYGIKTKIAAWRLMS